MEKANDKTATAVSMYQTVAEIGDNQAPSFTDGDTTTRGVREDAQRDTNIGFPVVATDRESEEELSYWLGTGGDEAMFSIDAATGYLKTKDELDHETNDSHSVTVMVTDSSGTNSDSITVTIDVLDADESPTVTGTATIELMEGETDLDGTGTTDVYTASDQEGGTITFSLGGADKDLFKLEDQDPAVANTKVLAFIKKPDFEMPMDSNKDNVYEVTVQASDDANMGMKAVTVKITNMQEDGKVEVTPAQPRIGIPVTAELTDSDVVSYGPMWNWERASDCGSPTWVGIRGAASATYTPNPSDLDYCLRAVAMYNDGFHEGTADGTTGIYPDIANERPNRFDKTANMVLAAVQYPSNNLPPAFASASTMRFVPENAAVGNDVGEPVTADDPNGADDLVAGGYSLSGTDQASFDINSGTGQLMTGMKFNHEDKEKYTVTVTAQDSFGATDSIKVDIYVVDADEMPPIRKSGLAIEGGSVKYDENGTMTVETYTASGPMADNARWTLMGDDARYFMLEPTTGMSSMLKFRNSPDYETPRGMAMSDTNTNTYMVTVKASDGTHTAMREVTGNGHRRGRTRAAVRRYGQLTVSHMENSMDARGESTLSPDVGGGLRSPGRWMGDDARYFKLDGSTGMSTYAQVHQRPRLRNAAMGACQRATPTRTPTWSPFKAEAGGEMDMVEVTVMVTNEEELGTLTADMVSPIDHSENSMDTVATYTASGSMADNAIWTTMGADADDFTITGGMLKFSSAPDYESPMGGADNDSNTYMVTVMAEAGGETAMHGNHRSHGHQRGGTRYADRRSGRRHRPPREQHGHGGNLHGLRLDGGQCHVDDDGR